MAEASRNRGLASGAPIAGRLSRRAQAREAGESEVQGGARGEAGGGVRGRSAGGGGEYGERGGHREQDGKCGGECIGGDSSTGMEAGGAKVDGVTCVAVAYTVMLLGPGAGQVGRVRIGGNDLRLELVQGRQLLDRPLENPAGVNAAHVADVLAHPSVVTRCNAEGVLEFPAGRHQWHRFERQTHGEGCIAS